MPNVPTRITTETELDDLLSEPSLRAIEALRQIEGDVMLLGAGGKMGPSLARMARRASDLAGVQRRVIAVSRFSRDETIAELTRHGVEALRCDLLDPRALAALPEAPNLVFMTGQKFGTGENPGATWAMNSFLPGAVCLRFPRCRRLVAFSTGNVYGLSPVSGRGSREEDAPGPVGEYAMSALGRERVLEHFSRALGIPMALIRLNYACELRYGVIVDLAQTIWRGEEVPLEMGHFNTIWQGDANAMALAAFAQVSAPPRVLNVTGAAKLSVRAVCQRLGELLGREPIFRGREGKEALLSDARRGLELLGPERIETGTLTEWVADWVRRGGLSLGKPTHFEARDGRF